MNPTGFAVILKDNNGNQVAYIENKIEKLSWDWDRIGGCGACRMTIKEDWDATLAASFAEDYNVEIYMPTPAGTAALWYGGYIDKVTPQEDGNDSNINVFCLGYINQLKRVIVDAKTYTGKELSYIAQNIAEVYATGITAITSAAADYVETDFIADTLYFNEDAYSVMVKLASIAGRREWGVRADKSFFFLGRSDKIERYYHIPEDFINFSPIKDFNPIITRLYLEGSDGYKQIFTVTNKITTREKKETNSAIKSQSVGQQFARMYLKEHGVAKRSYMGTLAEKDTRIESALPLGKTAINIKIGIKNLYDVTANLYDSGLKYDGGLEAFQIEKINYTLTDDGVMITINFGPLPPNIVDEFAKLEYLIDTERIKT